MTDTKKSIISGLGLNNLVLQAQIAGGGKPNANHNKIHKISRQETNEIYLILFDNGIVTFTGIDKDGNQTLSFSDTPCSETLTEAFGEGWLETVSKAQAYSDKALLDIKEVKERMMLSKADYLEAQKLRPVSLITRK